MSNSNDQLPSSTHQRTHVYGSYKIPCWAATWTTYLECYTRTLTFIDNSSNLILMSRLHLPTRNRYWTGVQSYSYAILVLVPGTCAQWVGM